MNWHTVIWLFAISYATAGVLFLLYLIGRVAAWRRECRQTRAMVVFRPRPSEKKARVSPVIEVPSSIRVASPESKARALCRRSECITLYLNGDLATRSQKRFEAHCRDCDYCGSEVERLSRLRSQDQRCVWERDIRPYIDRKLSGSGLEQFKGHLSVCEYCRAEVENDEERLENWLAEWGPILELEYRPRSHG